MKIAFTTVFDPKNVQNWSGTPFYMSNAFEQVADVEYISNLKNKTPLAYKFKKSFKKGYLLVKERAYVSILKWLKIIQNKLQNA